MELFVVAVITALLLVVVVIENGSCSLKLEPAGLDPKHTYAAPRLRRQTPDSSRISRLSHKRRPATTAKSSAGFERGRKHFDPEEDGFLDDFGFRKGQYEFGQKEYLDFTDIRNNVPGEPGIDYAAYLEVPKTKFSCIGRTQGYYADEETGCQVFHVCGNGTNDNDQISSFLCPVGSLFNQHLLTCDWWSKVVCSSRLMKNFARASDLNLLVMLMRSGQQQPPVKQIPQYRSDAEGPRHEKDMTVEINGKQTTIQKALDYSPIVGTAAKNLTRQVGPAIADRGSAEHASDKNTARATMKNQQNKQSIQHGSFLIKDEFLDMNKGNRKHSTAEMNKTEIKPTAPSLNEIGSNSGGGDARRATASDTMEGEESVGLINAHSKRTDLSVSVKLMTKLPFFRVLTTAGADGQSAAAATDDDEIMKKYSSKSNKLEAGKRVQTDFALNSTELNGGGGSVDTITATAINSLGFESPQNENVTVVEKNLKKNVSTRVVAAPEDQAEAAALANVLKRRYKMQNIHNVTGFILNRPRVVAAAAPAVEEDVPKLHSNLKFDTFHQQQRPAMAQQLSRPQTQWQQRRKSKSALERAKIESILENNSIKQNSSSTDRGTDMLTSQVTASSSLPAVYSRSQHLPEVERFRVNYHTHYYPEIYSKYKNNQRSVAADHADESVDMLKSYGETNYAVPHDKSQLSTSYDYRHYDDDDEQPLQTDDVELLKIFGSRIAPAAKSSDNGGNYHHQQQYLKVINNFEISRDAYKINSEFQQGSVEPPAGGLLGIMSTQQQMVVSAYSGGNLPRPFAVVRYGGGYSNPMNSQMLEDVTNSYGMSGDYDDDSLKNAMAADNGSTSVENSSSSTASTDGEVIDNCCNGEYTLPVSAGKEEQMHRNRGATVQTELIVSLGFDLSNDEEKKRYFENLQQQESSWGNQKPSRKWTLN